MKSEMTRSSASPNGDRAADDADREEDISAGDFRLHWHVYEYVYNPSAAAKREARCRICLFLVILCVLVVTVLVPRIKERTNGNVVRRAPAPAGPAAGASRNTDDDKTSRASRTATDTRPTAKPPNAVKDITADGDAFRFLCGGQPVRTPKQNEEYRFFALPFDGAAATSAAWDTCWGHLSSAFPFLDWNYFDGIFDTTPADRSAFENMDEIVRNNNGVVHWYPFQPSSSPTSTKRQRRAPVDEDRKQQLFQHFSQFDSGAAFLILVDPKTERVVWQATWQHSARGAHPFRTAFINKIQSAAKQQQQDQEQIDLSRSGDLLCSAGVLQAMTSMQRLYNSEHSAIYLEQVFPAAVAEQRFFRTKNAKGQAVGAQEDIFDETHFLRKVIIADGSWATLPYSDGDAEPTAADVAAQRWLAGPGRVPPPATLAPRPGVLQNTLWRYTKDEPQQLYLIDNYVPVDDIGIEVQEAVGGSAAKSASIIPTTSGREGGASPHTDAAVSGAHFQPLKNHPQPIEAVGKTAECACYQSPWLSGTFGEPALLLSSFVPGQVRIRTGTEAPPLPSGTYDRGQITDPGLTVSKDATNSQSQQKSRTPPSSPPQQINKKPAGETENAQKENVSDELIIQDWRFTYIYDIPAVGPTTSPAPKPLRLPAIPRVEWVTHDITPLAEQQRKARGMQAKQVADRAAAAEKRIRDDEIANEIRRSNFAAHEHEFLTDRSAGPDSTQIWKPAADAYARDKQAVHDFVDKATWEQLQQKVLQPDLHVDISEGAGIARSASAAREGLFTEGGASGKVG